MGNRKQHFADLTLIGRKTLFQRNNFTVTSHMIGKMLDKFSKNSVL